MDPPPFETLPFYLVQIRSFLRHDYGHAMWLKGNSGGERAAWLLYDDTVVNHVEKLLSQPLEAGGIFEVTGTLDDAQEIVKRYLLRREMEAIGKVDLPEFSLGSKQIPHPGPKEWWEKFPWKQGFWYKHSTLGGKPHYRHISADYATSHQDKRGLMLCLRNFVETAISYRGKDPPQLYVDQEETIYLWEQDIRSWIQEAVSLEQVKKDETEWNSFLDAVKIGG